MSAVREIQTETARELIRSLPIEDRLALASRTAFAGSVGIITPDILDGYDETDLRRIFVTGYEEGEAPSGLMERIQAGRIAGERLANLHKLGVPEEIKLDIARINQIDGLLEKLHVDPSFRSTAIERLREMNLSEEILNYRPGHMYSPSLQPHESRDVLELFKTIPATDGGDGWEGADETLRYLSEQKLQIISLSAIADIAGENGLDSQEYRIAALTRDKAIEAFKNTSAIYLFNQRNNLFTGENMPGGTQMQPHDVMRYVRERTVEYLERTASERLDLQPHQPQPEHNHIAGRNEPREDLTTGSHVMRPDIHSYQYGAIGGP